VKHIPQGTETHQSETYPSDPNQFYKQIKEIVSI